MITESNGYVVRCGPGPRKAIDVAPNEVFEKLNINRDQAIFRPYESTPNPAIATLGQYLLTDLGWTEPVSPKLPTIDPRLARLIQRATGELGTKLMDRSQILAKDSIDITSTISRVARAYKPIGEYLGWIFQEYSKILRQGDPRMEWLTEDPSLHDRSMASNEALTTRKKNMGDFMQAYQNNHDSSKALQVSQETIKEFVTHPTKSFTMSSNFEKANRDWASYYWKSASTGYFCYELKLAYMLDHSAQYLTKSTPI
ncbi:hypothetical protein N7493_005377 [Penicillium malachiteum]|uniref:Uncharacterized protein n=1 Tax=Penicillium malachiteum TaxID=1324776 RepID=A0AAD6MWS2_9EURO|nr:hypothetical protein N7493_005377 [Penicillium malachiteum]